MTIATAPRRISLSESESGPGSVAYQIRVAPRLPRPAQAAPTAIVGHRAGPGGDSGKRHGSFDRALPRSIVVLLRSYIACCLTGLLGADSSADCAVTDCQ